MCSTIWCTSCTIILLTNMAERPRNTLDKRLEEELCTLQVAFTFIFAREKTDRCTQLGVRQESFLSSTAMCGIA